MLKKLLVFVIIANSSTIHADYLADQINKIEATCQEQIQQGSINWYKAILNEYNDIVAKFSNHINGGKKLRGYANQHDGDYELSDKDAAIETCNYLRALITKIESFYTNNSDTKRLKQSITKTIQTIENLFKNN